MGLTFFTFLAIILMVVFVLRVRGTGTSLRAFRVAAIASVVYAAAVAAGYLYAEYQRYIALLLVRGAGASAAVSYLFFMRLALAYPGTKRLFILDAAFAVFGALCFWFIGFTDAYAVDVRRIVLDFVIFEGPYYYLVITVGSAVGLAAAVLVAIRAVIIKSRLYQQHLMIMALGIGAWAVWGYIFALLSPLLDYGKLYPLSALNGLFAIAASAYALSASRTFQVSTVARGLVSWILILVVFGAPAGIATAEAFLLGPSAPVLTIVLSGLTFLVFGRWAESFARGRVGSGRDEEGRESLESSIAHLDLSTGRDTVLETLDGILKRAIGCSWFQMLSEDDTGNLRRVHPDDDTIVTVADSPLMETLSSVDNRVIFKSDIEMDDTLKAVKAALRAFFEVLGAEAIVLAKEGRRTVGVFAFGPKSPGADYDAHDYATFEAIHGKLFVVAYYTRHVARESLLETVEKEIGLADQVVRSVQERIDPIVHPGVSVAHRNEAPRGLGGDLFDSVQISEHRWFFVVGDISGKGLSASMSMIMLKSMIRTLLREETDFIKLVSRVNTFIKDRLPRGTFFSGLFGFLALDKGSLYFINCGIPAMFHRSPGLESVMEAQGEGKMLGFVKNIEPFLKTRKLALPPGSRLVLTTDGAIDAESIRGERYGKERFTRILGENKAVGARETVDAIIRSASAFAGGKIDDDVTVVVMDFEGQAKEKKR